jgi:cytochrome b561
MQSNNTALRYGSVAMTLHWLIAVLLIGNICVGLYFADLPRSDPNLFMLVQLHKSIGLSVLTLSVLRVIWRLINPVPPLPAGMNPWLRIGARTSHVVLYILIVAIPLTGWMMVSASRMGTPTSFFGLFDWPNFPFFSNIPMASKRPTHELFESAHVFLAWSAIVLIPLHIGAALFHHFVRRDDVLKRMLPGTTV